jgi:hypothetical protein
MESASDIDQEFQALTKVEIDTKKTILELFSRSYLTQTHHNNHPMTSLMDHIALMISQSSRRRTQKSETSSNTQRVANYQLMMSKLADSY